MKVETPEEDRSDGGIPERGNNAGGIPLSACTTVAAGYRHRPSIPGRQGAGARRYAVKDTAVETLLCRYVERQWLNKSSIGAARMSVRGNPARTNNAVESFHSALRRRVKVAHPICTRSWGICSAPQQIPKPKSLD